MDISENLLCLYTSQVNKKDGSYIIEVPEREITTGLIEEENTYRVAVLSTQATNDAESTSQRDRYRDRSEPPVDKGEVLDVEIENIGDQGDGIARVGPGYVVIVSDTDVGERVSVEITEARENVAFAKVVERYDR